MTENERRNMWTDIWAKVHDAECSEFRLRESIKTAIIADSQIPRVSTTLMLDGTRTIVSSKID